MPTEHERPGLLKTLPPKAYCKLAPRLIENDRPGLLKMNALALSKHYRAIPIERKRPSLTEK